MTAGAGPADRKAPGQVPAAQVPADARLVDVREPEEWAAGHAPAATHIPLGQLGARYMEIPQDGQVYLIRDDTKSHQQANPGLSHAEALRLSMLRMIDNPEWAQPGLWAPFVIVGEPKKYRAKDS